MKKAKIITSIVLAASMLVGMTACGHEHTYSEDWSSDKTNHWHAPTCDDTEENIDVAAHTDVSPKDGKCDVCGYDVGIPTHTHVDANADKKCDEYGETVYNITFKNGDDVIASTFAQTGDMVNIPEAPQPAESRYSFNGWEGVTASELTAGKVEVFNSDKTYTANWHEQFGTDKVVEIAQVRQLADIEADGVKETAYDDAVAIDITSGNTTATAKAYVLWSSDYFYVFVDVKDSTVNDEDFVELRLELLHTDKYAPADWNGGWGGHRKDAASEGGWKLKSGSTATEKYWEYWSHLTDERGTAYGTTVRNGEGYTAEWVIKVETDGFDSVEENIVPHIGQEIGMGILINDAGTGTAAIENFAGYNSSVKKLTNTKLVENVKNDPNAIVANVNGARANWDASNSAIRDEMFNMEARFPDASIVEIGESKLKVLWTADKLYIRPVAGENTKSLKLTVGSTDYTVNLSDPAEIAIDGSYRAKDLFDFSVTYQDGDAESVTQNGTFKLQASTLSRNVYSISQLANGVSIAVDGEKDAGYTDNGIAINTTTEGLGASAVTGVANFKWDNEYLYVLVEVTDANVTPADSQKGDSYNNDSVELWINTCRTLPNKGWGEIRPDSGYCGEGGFRVQTNNEVTGQHWMYDWKEVVSRETAVKLTDNGYNVEYKIHLSAFAGVEDKVGQYIDLMININSDDNNDGKRDGVTSLNAAGNAAWDQPWTLDRFELVA